MRRFARAISLVSMFGYLVGSAATFTPANPAWNRPMEPFTIVGNLHYVGATDVSAFLITTAEGHILIDGGFREAVPQLERSIVQLGYRLEDVRLLLISHAHYDHVGCVAELKARTGARLLAHPADHEALRRGGSGDFAFGDHFLFPPAEPDAALRDGESVALGATVLTAHHTPGHTRGSTTWSLAVADGEHTRQVVIASSLTAPGYQLAANLSYPGIVADFESSFAKLRSLPCDILLSSHSWDFGLHERVAARAETPSINPFVDREALGRYVAAAEEKFRKQIAEQSADMIPPATNHATHAAGNTNSQ